jgi:CubicO group peptidase (beta-lactamase class C family)
VIGLSEEPNVVPFQAGTLSALARKHQVPGAQLAIHHNGRTETYETGEVEARTNRRVTRDLAFPIGSITKSFTATVALILAADGDLALDAPIGDHLTGLGELGGRLTLRQLLSHTGGLASGPELAEQSTLTSRRYAVEHCHPRNLLMPPGLAFSYSDLGYIVASSLIETTTGMGWWEATDTILLRPLGIEPAFVGAHAPRRSGRPIAPGHSVNPLAGRTRAVRPVLAAVEASTGGLAVSATDLVTFGLLHIGSDRADLLPPAYAKEMREPIAAAEPFGLADGWGLGLAQFRVGDTDWVGHDGNFDGTACYLRIDPDGGRVIALVSNANTGAGLWRELWNELGATGGVGGGASAVAERVMPPAGCSGTYSNGDQDFVVLARDGGRLHLGVDGEFGALSFHDGLVFSLRDPNSGRRVLGGRFLRDPVTGALDYLQINGRLARRQDGVGREISSRRIA